MKKFLTTIAALLLLSSSVSAQITPTNIFSTNQVILAASMNENFSDLGGDALDRTGGTITGNIAVDTNITVDGVDISDYLATNVFAQDSGLAADPSFSWVGDPDNGMFLSTTNAVGLATAGVEWFTLDASGDFTLHDASAADVDITFDGNEQDFYICLDDSANDLVLGLGATCGTTPGIAIDENQLTTLGGSLLLNSGASSFELRIGEPSGGGSSYTGFKAPALAGNVIYTLPTADGAASTFLQTDGAGATSWAAAGGLLTGYAATLLDVENTASTVASITFTIPANDWADGDQIHVWFIADDKNNKGSAGTTTFSTTVGAGGSVTLASATWNDSPYENQRVYSLYYIREGSTVWVYSEGNQPSSHPNQTIGASPLGAGAGGREGSSTPTNFTSDFNVVINVILSAANAAYYHNVRSARIFRISES